MLFFRSLAIIGLFSQFIFASSLISIIVSKDSNIEQISKGYIKNLFLSKTKQLPNGNKAIVIEPNNSEFNKKFYKAITNKSQKQLKKYWATMIFTGKGQPAKKIKNLNEIFLYVKDNPNVISYVPKSSIKNNEVKILLDIQ